MDAPLLVALCLLASIATGQVSNDPEPEFLAPLDNITVTQGRDVSFTCVVDHLGPYKVAWIKSDSKAILAIHTHLVAHNTRLAVTHNGHNTWRLHVNNVQRNDSGSYMCQVNTDPMTYQTGQLDVVVPPDILDDENGRSAEAAPEGGSVRLRCDATGVPQPSVVWRREDGRDIVLRDSTRERGHAVRTVEGESLLLSGVLRTDMGVYLCVASNGVPPSVSKRFPVSVHFHPLIKVANQLVLAPIGSDVLLQCYGEASPRALNSWHRETGEKLIANDKGKHRIKETILGEYSVLMNLTVKRLEKDDFGTYTCSSVNALGRVEASVRLQELDLPPPPKSTADPGRRTKTPPHSKVDDGYHNNKHNKKTHRGKASGSIGLYDALESDGDRSYLTAPVVPTTPNHVEAPRLGPEGAHHATSPPRFYFPGVENKATTPRHLPGTLPLAVCAVLQLFWIALTL